jgi:hypothetical protein
MKVEQNLTYKKSLRMIPLIGDLQFYLGVFGLLYFVVIILKNYITPI